MKRTIILMGLILIGLMGPGPIRAALPDPPPESAADYGFAQLDENTMSALLQQGSLVIVRQRPDGSLQNVTAGILVDAPLEVVWSTIIDFDHYPQFMPQTSEEKVLQRESDNLLLVEQTLSIAIWRLPAIKTNYQLAQALTPRSKLRFWHVSGDLAGTYGGWDLVPAGQRTMIFYTLYSNLTSLGWGLGGIFKAEPDFMAGINVTTALVVTRAMKAECERRAKPRN